MLTPPVGHLISMAGWRTLLVKYLRVVRAQPLAFDMYASVYQALSE